MTNNTAQQKKAMIEAMRKSLGIISKACQIAKVGRTTYYDWYNEDADFRAEIDAVAEEVIDFVESALHKRIKAGDTTAIIFHLKCKAKKRGYVDKEQDADHAAVLKEVVVRYVTDTTSQAEA